MSNVLKFLGIVILLLSFGVYLGATPELETVKSNQDELIALTHEVPNYNDSDLVIANGSTLIPEISIPYIGGIINAILYPIKIAYSILSLILSYVTALIDLTNAIPDEATPLIVVGMLYIIFMLLTFMVGILKGRI